MIEFYHLKPLHKLKVVSNALEPSIAVTLRPTIGGCKREVTGLYEMQIYGIVSFETQMDNEVTNQATEQVYKQFLG